MTRIFLPPDKLTSTKINLDNEQSRYLALVLRAQPDDRITVMDGQGFKYDCRLIAVHKKEVVAEVLSKTPYSVESPLSITLAQGLAKGDKMDFIVQKSTELGVRRIIPIITERTQVRQTEKVERWRRIALSASQQSGRDKVPEIDEPIELQKYLKNQMTSAATSYIEEIKDIKLKPAARIILSARHQERNLKEVLSLLKEPQSIYLLIGPEGGFSEEEVSSAVEKGFIEVSLGPRILRTETAPIAAISVMQYELGDAG